MLNLKISKVSEKATGGVGEKIICNIRKNMYLMFNEKF